MNEVKKTIIQVLYRIFLWFLVFICLAGLAGIFCSKPEQEEECFITVEVILTQGDTLTYAFSNKCFLHLAGECLYVICDREKVLVTCDVKEFKL